MSFTILAIIVLALLAGVFVVLTRRDTAAVRAAGQAHVADDEDRVVSEPVPVNGTAQLAEPNRITWTKQFDPSSAALDDDARLRLIEDLALLRAPWCVPILEQASREESDRAHRDAAQRALALCRETGSSTPTP
jgi:hypothetical protein